MKECWNCLYYLAYYTKGFCKFDRENHGLCYKHKKTVENRDGCDSWGTNSVKRKMRKTVCIKALNEALSNLSEIKQILCEDSDESKGLPVLVSKKTQRD